MKLVYAAASPFVRKVHVVLHETGLLDEVEIVPVVTSPFDSPAEIVAANPLGKVPALIRDEGPSIYDSRVICRYLDDRAQGGLYPRARIWEVLTLEATADAIMEAALSIVYEHRFRRPEAVNEGWCEAQWRKIERAVAALNGRWMSHLSGPLDAGQIAVGCALAYLDFRLGDRNWRKGNDALDDWFAVFAEREAMQATRPE